MPPRVKSAQRALDILEVLTRHPEGCTFTTICQALRLPKSSAHDLLMMLTERRYLRWDPADGAYRLGMKLFELASTCTQMLPLIDIARPIMRRLADTAHETSHLAVLDGIDVLYLAKEQSSTPVPQIATAVGSRLPAHLTATGKLLLAYQPEAYLRSLFPSEKLPTNTAKSVATWQGLQAQLTEIRCTAFAIDREETIMGIVCIAAPIFFNAPEPIAAVSLTLLSAILGEERLAVLRQQLVAAAQAISSSLAGQTGVNLLPLTHDTDGPRRRRKPATA